MKSKYRAYGFLLLFFFPNKWGFSYSQTDSNQELFPN